MASLNEKLQVALESRARRKILRRLPSPTRSNPDESSSTLVDFVSNDYLSLTSSATFRQHFLDQLQNAPDILGSGGSRLLVNGTGHAALEARLTTFFSASAALLFNSGFDANAGLFACVPQAGDVVLYDEHVHASVHDGVRASRAVNASYAFPHNSVRALREALIGLLGERPALRTGEGAVFVAIESLYSMDGTFAPLREIVGLMEALLPKGNGHLIVDEAHATGLYGPQGRGLVAHWGLEEKVFVRLHTFGKALASSGAVVLTSPIVKEYLLNYARSLIYTTSLSSANVVAINCSFDILEDGTATELANFLKDLVQYTLDLLQCRLVPFPPDLVSLPSHLINQPLSELLSPIIPIMTLTPRPLSALLRERGLNARPISWPTVPKGKDRVRVCLHARNTKEDVDRLVEGIVRWAEGEMKVRARVWRKEKERAIGVLLEAKL